MTVHSLLFTIGNCETSIYLGKEREQREKERKERREKERERENDPSYELEKQANEKTKRGRREGLYAERNDRLAVRKAAPGGGGLKDSSHCTARAGNGN